MSTETRRNFRCVPFRTAGLAAPSTRSGSPDRFPSTRYQGSKRRFVGDIVRHLEGLTYHTVLDAFGGSGAVSYAFKCAGKAVTYNDILKCNQQVGLALVENDRVRLDEGIAQTLGQRRRGGSYSDFIETFFRDVYFTDEENRWLDLAVGNVRAMRGRFARAIAWFGLFQAALAKRPYNLFHRRNLYMRTARVPRSFGNKASWDRGFEDHVRHFISEANAAVYGSGATCRALCGDAMEREPGFDLVYVDPPYVNRRGVGVDYHHFYHFLEGMANYENWPTLIDETTKHRRLCAQDNPWTDARRCILMFERLFERFRSSILVVSYRSDGIPSIDDLRTMLRRVKRRVRVHTLNRVQYALSTNRSTREMLLIGTDD